MELFGHDEVEGHLATSHQLLPCFADRVIEASVDDRRTIHRQDLGLELGGLVPSAIEREGVAVHLDALQIAVAAVLELEGGCGEALVKADDLGGDRVAGAVAVDNVGCLYATADVYFAVLLVVQESTRCKVVGGSSVGRLVGPRGSSRCCEHESDEGDGQDLTTAPWVAPVWCRRRENTRMSIVCREFVDIKQEPRHKRNRM